jgi:D-alanyl-D-alanine carboxypeptidase
MKNKNLETLMYSAGGIIALALILVAANFIFSALNARVDLTEGRVYTLSEGTRSILGKLEAPVKLGQQIAEARLELDGKLLATIPLLAQEAVDEGSFIEQLIDQRV